MFGGYIASLKTRFLSRIWRLKVLPKIKHLVWTMCRGYLPTRVRLEDKGVQGPIECVSCVSSD